MILESAELRIVKLRLLRPFETSFGVQSERTIPILTLRAGGLEGYSEGVMEELPLYREETITGALALVKEAFSACPGRQEPARPAGSVGPVFSISWQPHGQSSG